MHLINYLSSFNLDHLKSNQIQAHQNNLENSCFRGCHLTKTKTKKKKQQKKNTKNQHPITNIPKVNQKPRNPTPNSKNHKYFSILITLTLKQRIHTIIHQTLKILHSEMKTMRKQSLEKYQVIIRLSMDHCKVEKSYLLAVRVN